MSVSFAEQSCLQNRAAVECFKQKYNVDATVDDFEEHSGRGEIIYLGKVAEKYKVDNFDIDDCKQSFYQVYEEKYAIPEAGIGFPGGYGKTRLSSRSNSEVVFQSDSIFLCFMFVFLSSLYSMVNQVQLSLSRVAKVKVGELLWHLVQTGSRYCWQQSSFLRDYSE